MRASELIRRLFALPDRERVLAPIPPTVVDAAWPEAGQITFIGGASGGGKSRLLAALRERATHPLAATQVRWIEPADLPLGDACVVDRVCDELGLDEVAFVGPIDHARTADRLNADPAATANAAARRATETRVTAALELLGRVGLAEAWTYLQKPAELSDGQRWRLLLALAVARCLRQAPPPAAGRASFVDPPLTIIAIDEFAALLDRVTARIVARALRRLIDRPGQPPIAAVIATSHDDLRIALSPDRIIAADFGEYDSAGGVTPPVDPARVCRKRTRRCLTMVKDLQPPADTASVP